MLSVLRMLQPVFNIGIYLEMYNGYLPNFPKYTCVTCMTAKGLKCVDTI